MKFESRVSGGLQTHIPSDVARHLNLVKGDMLVWDVQNGKVELSKKEQK